MRIHNTLGVSRQTLIDELLKGICQVSFTKVKDGSNRVIYCTLNLLHIPAKYEKSVEKIISQQPVDDDILPIWDITEGKWKSFRISKMSLFVTSDELEKENRTGHNVITKNSEILKERKEKAIQEFKQRIENLKKKAKEVTDRMKGLQNEN